MNRTNIGWTDFTVNPIRARNRETGKAGHFCVKLSEGCANCYASEWNEHRYGTGLAFEVPNQAKVEMYLHEPVLQEIVAYKGPPARCFICDMTDMFGEWVPDEWLDRIFAVMALQPRLAFQVLTKRPERMREYQTNIEPLPNVWLGVTTETQRTADERIPILLDTPAAVRFVSAEPLLEAVDLSRIDTGEEWEAAPLRASVLRPSSLLGRQSLDWIIVGGESGAHRRLFDPAWAESIVRQCDAAGVPVFVKQGGAFKPGQQADLPDALWARKEFPR